MALGTGGHTPEEWGEKVVLGAEDRARELKIDFVPGKRGAGGAISALTKRAMTGYATPAEAVAALSTASGASGWEVKIYPKVCGNGGNCADYKYKHPVLQRKLTTFGVAMKVAEEAGRTPKAQLFAFASVSERESSCSR